MPHQTNYQWRPNDNGSITNHRYDIEAEKWVHSINKATAKAKPTDWGADFGFIGDVLSLIPILLIIIFCIPLLFLKYVVGFNIKIFPGDEPTGWIDKRTDVEKIYDRMEQTRVECAARRKSWRSTHGTNSGTNSGNNRKTTWEDLTPEQQKMVRFVQAETAKAKANMKRDTN